MLSSYQIVLFGAGKSAGVLIEYLKNTSSKNKWNVLVADFDLSVVQQKVGDHSYVKAAQINIQDTHARQALVQSATIVISMLPHAMHYLVAQDCVLFSKHLLTASYIDEKIREMENQIQENGLIFLCEMGLDPGIDHMSAMKILDAIKKEQGEITSFKSHCGGLVAPESDDNPWHYKISWNPRNIVLAGKAGAIYIENGQEKSCSYQEVFSGNSHVKINAEMDLAYYPNRDSLSYISLYQLHEAQTFVRTTLRYPEFINGWKYIVALRFTDEQLMHDTTKMTIAGFFRIHLEQFGFSNPDFPFTKKDFETGNDNPETQSLFVKQMEFLGLHDQQNIGKGYCSAADIFQFILENKLKLNSEDKDMIVMLHEIEYNIHDKSKKIHSCLVVKGENSIHTAMAKTVGLPLGIAATLILENKLNLTGLHIPILPEIYNPVLERLEEEGIQFHETIS
ncbi:MAG: saccharopine dehydrogenase NADP-binding domain-containing protein [Bacteroidetes bacterium]|nr:saccharopine dehydrogenase NADP-binding domain-containing protein [Bacteroidota bacterium]